MPRMRDLFRGTKSALRTSRSETEAGQTVRTDARQAAGALSRALLVLDCFGDREEWSFTELCRELGVHRSTVFRSLATFEAAGYLERNHASGRYRPGPKFLRIEKLLLQSEPVRWVALAPLQELGRRTGETAHVGVLWEGDAVTVQLVEGTHAVRMHSHVGKRAAAHASALGKSLLAYLPEEEIDAFVERFGLRPLTPRTVTEPGALKAALRAIRERGYTLDDGEYEEGLRCLGVAVPEPPDHPFAAVSVSGPRTRLTPERDVEIVGALRDAAGAIATTLSRLRMNGAGLVRPRR
jgi:IclR family acetate operon transcriptional repressor